MKNIEQILKEAGIEVTDEQKTAINAAVTENYKTIDGSRSRPGHLQRAA